MRLPQSQMNLVLNTLQVSSCIPVSAEEVISYILHKNPHRQLDQESDADSVPEDGIDAGRGHATKGSRVLASPPRSGARGAANGGSASPQRMAERAAMRSLRGHRQYIIVDCRPRQAFDACRLAPALHLNPDLLVSPDDLDAKLKEFMPLQVGIRGRGQRVSGVVVDGYRKSRSIFRTRYAIATVDSYVDFFLSCRSVSSIENAEMPGGGEQSDIERSVFDISILWENFVTILNTSLGRFGGTLFCPQCHLLGFCPAEPVGCIRRGGMMVYFHTWDRQMIDFHSMI